jgi:mono/diheme cytochrome c family protein
VRTLAFSPRPTPSVSPRMCCIGLAAALGGGVGAGCGDPPRRFTAPLVLGGQEVAPEVLDRGARVYGLYCVSCHGADGSGQAAVTRSMATPPRDFREAAYRYVSGPEGSLPTDADLEATIRHGRPSTGMPAWDGLPAEDLHAVVQYLKTLSPRWTTETPPVEAPERLPGSSPALPPARVGEG